MANYPRSAKVPISERNTATGRKSNRLIKTISPPKWKENRNIEDINDFGNMRRDRRYTSRSDRVANM